MPDSDLIAYQQDFLTGEHQAMYRAILYRLADQAAVINRISPRHTITFKKSGRNHAMVTITPPSDSPKSSCSMRMSLADLGVKKFKALPKKLEPSLPVIAFDNTWYALSNRTLGEGNFGEVRPIYRIPREVSATLHRWPSESRVAKLMKPNHSDTALEEYEALISSVHSPRNAIIKTPRGWVLNIERIHHSVYGTNLKGAIHNPFFEPDHAELIDYCRQYVGIIRDYNETKHRSHRDGVPDNVALTKDRTLKLMDFGCSTSHLENTAKSVRQLFSLAAKEDDSVGDLAKRTDRLILGISLLQLLLKPEYYSHPLKARNAEIKRFNTLFATCDKDNPHQQKQVITWFLSKMVTTPFNGVDKSQFRDCLPEDKRVFLAGWFTRHLCNENAISKQRFPDFAAFNFMLDLAAPTPAASPTLPSRSMDMSIANPRPPRNHRSSSPTPQTRFFQPKPKPQPATKPETTPSSDNQTGYFSEISPV